MKKLFLILSFIGFISEVKAQNVNRKWGYFIDANMGVLPVSKGFTSNSSLSFGLTHNKVFGLGLSFSKLTDDLDHAQGIGLEWRALPTEWLVFRTQYGVVLGASSGDNGAYARTFTYLPNESKKFYWRFTAGFRFWKAIFLGGSIMQTGDLTFRDDKPPYPNSIEIIRRSMIVIKWQLGIAISLSQKKKQ